MGWDKDLKLQQMDETLAQLQGYELTKRPRLGWVNAIRNALGMNNRQLAERLHVSSSRVIQLERHETSGSVSIKSLDMAAQALGCKFVYAFVPDESLANKRKSQAYKKAKFLVEFTERLMQLEDQGNSEEFVNERVKKLASDLLNKWPRDFWDDM